MQCKIDVSNIQTNDSRMLHHILFKVYLKKRSGRSAPSLERHTITCKLWSLCSSTYLVCVGPERAFCWPDSAEVYNVGRGVGEVIKPKSLWVSTGVMRNYSLYFLRGLNVCVETNQTKITTCRSLEAEFKVAYLKTFYFFWSWFGSHE